MLKKTITYVNYNDEEVTEDFFFNLSKAEVMQMQLSTSGKDGYAGYLQSIVNSKDVPSITKVFKDIILKSYGEKSPDGKRFIKSPELSTAFEQTEAFSVLYMELIQNADECKAFVEGVMPKEIKKEIAG